MNRPTLMRVYPSTAGSYTASTTFARQRIPVNSVDTGWSHAVKDRLEELVRLEKGWDGYQADPVSFDNAIFALSMLDATCLDDTPAPQIVPGVNGELQIEWHTELGDVEVLVRGPYDVHAWRSLDGDDEGEEIELTNDFLNVAHWIQDVTELPIALRAAA